MSVSICWIISHTFLDVCNGGCEDEILGFTVGKVWGSYEYKGSCVGGFLNIILAASAARLRGRGFRTRADGDGGTGCIPTIVEAEGGSYMGFRRSDMLREKGRGRGVVGVYSEGVLCSIF